MTRGWPSGPAWTPNSARFSGRSGRRSVVPSAATRRSPRQRGSGQNASSEASRRWFKATKAEAFSFWRAWDKALFVAARTGHPASDSNSVSSKVCSPSFQAHSRKAASTGKVRTRRRVKSFGLARWVSMKAGSRRVAARSARIAARTRPASCFYHVDQPVKRLHHARFRSLALNLTALGAGRVIQPAPTV